MLTTTRLIAATVLFGITVSAGAQTAPPSSKWKAGRKNPYAKLFVPPASPAAQPPSLPAAEPAGPVSRCETASAPQAPALDARLLNQLKKSGTRYTMRAVTPNCDRRE